MTVYKIPAPLDGYLQQLNDRFEFWQILLLILAVLFLLNLMMQIVGLLFGGESGNKPKSKRERDFSTRLPKASKVKAQLRESGLAIERPAEAPAPKSIPLVSDDEVTTKVSQTAASVATLDAPKLDTLEEVLNELERLDARIGRDKSGAVVMIALNGKQIPSGLLASLKFFPKLESLHLRRTNTSDADVLALTSFKNLRFLYVSETKLTTKGVEAVKKANANLKVEV